MSTRLFSSDAASDAGFTHLYSDARDRLLLQTWALTGDFQAAHQGVQEAFVITAHHWRKVRRRPMRQPEDATAPVETQEDWVRPLAWQHAQRRRSGHRSRKAAVAPDVQATLDALGQLSATERKVLLLANLSSVTLEQIGREIGIPAARAEQELQSATAGYARHREIPVSGILATFEALAAEAATASWTDADELTHSGTRRRLTHTLTGALVMLIVLVGAGAFVTQQGDSLPRLGALSFGDSDDATSAAATDEKYPLTPQDLVTPAEVDKSLAGRWRTEITSDNRGGSGLVLPCQQRQFAAEDSRAALVRTFTSTKRDLTAGQAVEASTDADQAADAYQRSLTWYSACTENRVQLVTTHQVRGLGDEATLVTLRDWARPENAVVFGVARTGSLTTSVAATVKATPSQAIPRVVKLLGTGVNRACKLPDAGKCASKPKPTLVKPLPIGSKPQLISEIDLPPVSGVVKPWVGAKVTKADTNLAATGCDATAFNAKSMSENWTRTFVIPGARKLSDAFGLTQSVGTFAKPAGAEKFVGAVKSKMDSCTDRQLGTEVTPLGGSSTKDSERAIWRVVTETSPDTSVTYLMAVMRQGNTVSQVGFVPSGGVTMSEDDFGTLAARAAARLGNA